MNELAKLVPAHDMFIRVPEPIIIYPVRDPEGRGVTFSVVQGERVAQCLAWDELLGEIAQMTHAKVGVGRYSRRIDDVVEYMVHRARRAREREREEQARPCWARDDDPTPWCSACGALTKAACRCGRLADND